MEVADDAGGGSASSPAVVAPPQYCVVGGTDGLIGGGFIAKTTAVAGIALLVESTDLLVELWLSLVLLVLFAAIVRMLTGKGGSGCGRLLVMNRGNEYSPIPVRA